MSRNLVRGCLIAGAFCFVVACNSEAPTSSQLSGGSELAPAAALPSFGSDSKAADPADPVTEAATRDEEGINPDAPVAPAEAGGAPGETEAEPPSEAGSPATSETTPPAVLVGEPAHFIDADVGFARCGIKEDHTLWCWGQATNWRHTWQQAVFPTQFGSDADWQSVSVGGDSMCGIRGQGTVYCWGYQYDANQYVLHAEPEQVGEAASWQSVSNGMGSTCALKKDGSLWCWGYLAELSDGAIQSSRAPIQIGTDSDWTVISTNGYRACGLKQSGELLCFGSNYDGGIGDGTSEDRAVPTAPLEPGPWLSVATGDRTCGVRADHTLWCWGLMEPVPTQVDENTDWEAIEGHFWTACGVRGGGKPYCFNRPGTIEAIDEMGGYTRVLPSCALHSDGTLRCWGPNSRGDGLDQLVPTPFHVGTDSDWTQISIGSWLTSGLHADGRLDTYRAPWRPEGGGWREVADGDYTKCGIRQDGTLWCWGRFFGTNDADYPNGNMVPAQVGSGADWLHVGMAREGWMCGIRAIGNGDSGSLWCEHPYYDKNVYQESWFNDWTTISVAYNTGCGTRADGSLWCWTMRVQCGGTGFIGVPQFERVGTDNDWQSSSVGAGYVCGVKTDGSLWCRGQNYAGVLGIGTFEATTEMTNVAPGTRWSKVAAGYFSTCGVQVDGSLWCWGDNAFGQLGVGWPGATRNVPTRVGSANDWQAVAVSNTYDVVMTCGLRSGQLWCWGDDRAGLVRRAPPTEALALVHDAPERLSGFCLIPRDLDYDGYADCQGDCDDADPYRTPLAGCPQP